LNLHSDSFEKARSSGLFFDGFLPRFTPITQIAFHFEWLDGAVFSYYSFSH